MTANNERDDWWKQAVVYQVYPRSFKDVNGDGLGDIAGVTEKMDYLKDLGVDAIWLSPFYPSDLADGGYDVIDYRNVDPRLGTMDDFDRMVAAAHGAGIKVIVDIVPNHTADKHVMFQEALAAGRGSAARDRYIFREGRGEHGELPPNDWQSLFGGPAWQQVDDGQWYLHIFAKEQPDLNWKNPDVHEEFKKTLRFWSDHGADGFRIDVAHGLAKDLESTPLEDMPADTVQQVLCHDFTSPLWDRREVHETYREWREVFDEYNPPRFAVGEAWVVPEHQHLYADTAELGQVFNFEFAEANWDVDEFRSAIRHGLEAAAETDGSTTTWVMNNHDVPRSPSRYGLPQVKGPVYHQLAHDWLLRDGTSYTEDRELGTRRARAAALMELALPGAVYVYQGEELGLFEVANIPWDRLEDPAPFNTRRNFTDKGRDGCRVPLPWVSDDRADDAMASASWSADFAAGTSFGFSPATRADGTPAAEPHLPQPLWFKDFAADVEAADEGSMLNLYRRALALRAKLLTATGDTSTVDWLDGDEGYDDVIAYARPATEGRTLTSVTNFGTEPVALPDGAVILASAPLTDDDRLPQDATAWLVR
ncbi:alpha-amylase [Bifidobacterium sp. UTCIF-37]|uniref:glycoside hydrolase family 13 protein n=1 Tax=unclassified Bifidobacterium TaxID=2608897 RepID=UPI00112BADE6|nr:MULTISPECIES: glycoside hydrolase family 13 protein [unclassified Bifidobacterium]TPF85667.1 alpha-amylase [Bifidobacterium sp. UTCIF-37]TPF87678.1 alpha-amylase [Bifidobacterium sp. UTCIF-38]